MTVVNYDLPAQILPEDDDYRRFSMSVFGGLTFENDDSGLRLFGSNLNLITEQSYNIGGGIQYAITPFWAIGGDYRYSTIDGGNIFETEVHSVKLKNYFNFNRFFRQYTVSEYLNPYLSLGIGRDFFTYESTDESISDHGINLSSGFGLGLNISETFEVFGQYELQFGSNSLDNIRTGFPSDLLGMASAGIRIYFGDQEKRRMSMAPPSVIISNEDYRKFHDLDDQLATVEDQSMEKEAELERLRSELSELDQTYNKQIQEMEIMLDQYSNKIESMEEEMAMLRSETEAANVIKEEIPAGHYVQVFATTIESIAQDVRRLVINMLNDTIENPQEEVIITLRRGFYEVRVGAYNDLSIAENVHDVVVEEFEDAFIVTFARPLNLREAYRDIRIIR